MKKIKDNENSELLIRELEEEGVDEFGRTFTKSKWIKAETEVNLGSKKKPNKKILEFKYNVPEDKKNNPIGSMLDEFFGGKK